MVAKATARAALSSTDSTTAKKLALSALTTGALYAAGLEAVTLPPLLFFALLSSATRSKTWNRWMLPALATFVTAAVPVAADLITGLQIDFRFDGNALDSGPHSVNLAHSNIGYTTDRFDNPGNAAYFNGQNSSAYFTPPFSLATHMNNYGDFTILAWAKRIGSVASQSAIFANGLPESFSTGFTVENRQPEGGLAYRGRTLSAGVGSIPRNIDIVTQNNPDWHCYAYHSELSQGLIHGVYDSIWSPISYGQTYNGGDIYTGRLTDGSNIFRGAISNLMVFSRALSVGDIAEFCNRTGIATTGAITTATSTAATAVATTANTITSAAATTANAITSAASTTASAITSATTGASTTGDATTSTAAGTTTSTTASTLFGTTASAAASTSGENADPNDNSLLPIIIGVVAATCALCLVVAGVLYFRKRSQNSSESSSSSTAVALQDLAGDDDDSFGNGYQTRPDSARAQACGNNSGDDHSADDSGDNTPQYFDVTTVVGSETADGGDAGGQYMTAGPGVFGPDAGTGGDQAEQYNTLEGGSGSANTSGNLSSSG